MFSCAYVLRWHCAPVSVLQLSAAVVVTLLTALSESVAGLVDAAVLLGVLRVLRFGYCRVYGRSAECARFASVRLPVSGSVGVAYAV